MMVLSIFVFQTSAASTNAKGNGDEKSTKQKAAGSDRVSDDNGILNQVSDAKNPFGAVKSKGETTLTVDSQASPQWVLQAQTTASPITISDYRV